jgi:hypothetical protein
MFELPKDIKYELKKKYPEVNVSSFFNDIMNAMINKTFDDGSCTIRKFGKFTAFQTYSTRLKQNVCKFKFQLSTTFNKKILTDKYLMQKLPVKKKTVFNENNQKKCEQYKDQKKENYELRQLSRQTEKIKTNERLAKYEVLEILSENHKENNTDV